MNRRLFILSIAALSFGAASALVMVTSQNVGPPKVRTSGVAAIGGAFTLTNTHGQVVTEKTFKGKFSLVFFGFTNCPDVCPVALQNITAALDMMGPNAEKITPIFITTDPERDSVEKVAKYIAGFHKNMVGLTGTPDQVKSAIKVYRVYAAKVKNADAPDGYTVEHASIIYLMGPDGKYVTHFNHTTTPKAMASRIILIMEQIDNSM